MTLRYFISIVLALFFSFGEKAGATVPPDLFKNTVFNAGDAGINSYRIPSIVTAKDGSLIVFCEARRDSWRDKSRTDIVMKRSIDNGVTWSAMQDLTKGTSGAFMDPTPLLDALTGRLFLFTTYWPEDDHSGTTNKAILLTSDDNGKSWSEPQDITPIFQLESRAIGGFGPGSGLQMKGEAYKGRLILPTRIIDLTTKKTSDVAVFSDDHGKTWTVGNNSDCGDELQIAESPLGTLIYNARVPNARMISRSLDGGLTWDKAVKDPFLPAVSKGCQAGILGKDNILYFSGIQGIPETPDWDERARLTLYKSIDGGLTWDNGQLLYEKASGYSCMTYLSDGRLAIIFETSDTQAFTRKSIPDIKPLKRPEGWMRLDIIILDL